MPLHSSGEAIAIERIRPQLGESRIEVSSPAFGDGEPIPDRYSEYGDGISRGQSPPLEWTPHPAAQAWALIVEDPDAPGSAPFVHWVAWNIPEGINALPQALAKTPRLQKPQGMIQGVNSAGEYGWYGCEPPDGDGPHRYHFQVFALSARLDMDADTPFIELLNALKGRVLAEGELIGTYERRTM
jgi:Raf kinase inhibitor-like YbhB/YbcL family protein